MHTPPSTGLTVSVIYIRIRAGFLPLARPLFRLTFSCAGMGLASLDVKRTQNAKEKQ